MLRLEFNHSLQDYYTEIDAVLLIGTSEWITSNDHSHNQSLNNLLEQFHRIDPYNEDIHNLTPNYLNANSDFVLLAKILRIHYTTTMYKKYYTLILIYYLTSSHLCNNDDK